MAKVEDARSTSVPLLNQLTLRGILALVGLLALVWFGTDLGRAEQLTLGVLVAAAGVSDLAAEWPRRHSARNARRLGRGTALLVLAMGLAAGLAEPTSRAAGRLLAAGLILSAAIDITTSLTQRRRTPAASWLLASGLAALAAGAILAAWPTGTVVVLLVGVAGGWIAVAALDVWATLRRYKTTANVETWGARTALTTWLQARELTPVACLRLVDKLTYGYSDIGRFFVQLALSVIIATLGVLTDSTAVVVGAMLIAPLMTPIMGLAEALVAGAPRRAGQSVLLIVGGTATAVSLSALLARVLPVFERVETNSQITARVSPTVLDLLIAVAAGIAGAFALSREDVRDSLPGVAIAVALVPPLSVVGIALQAGFYDDAAGAMLLFLTNLVSMLLAGGLTFVAAGAVPIEQLYREHRRVRVYGATVLCGVLVIAIPLLVTSEDLLTAATDHHAAQQVAEDWLAQRDGAQLVDVEIVERTVVVTAAGPGDPPQTESLVNDLVDDLGRDVELDLRWVYEARQVVSSSG